MQITRKIRDWREGESIIPLFPEPHSSTVEALIDKIAREVPAKYAGRVITIDVAVKVTVTVLADDHRAETEPVAP